MDMNNNDRCPYWEKMAYRGETGARCDKSHGHRGDHRFVGTFVGPWSKVIVAK